MIPGTSEARWGRLIRQLVRDAIHWSDALAGRMGTADPTLRGHLAAEAVGLAACMIGDRLRREDATADQLAVVADQLRAVWASAAARHAQSPATRAAHALHSHPAGEPGGLTSMQSLLVEGDRALLDQRQAAVEFQRATGLGSDALVDDGHNLAALIFYHRVFLAARGHPAFTPAHRAQIVKAAQQCRERLERVLRRAPAVQETTQPMLGTIVPRQLSRG